MVGPPAVGMVGLVAWIAAIGSADVGRMGATGLSSVLGWPYGLALLCVAVAFVWELWRPSPRGALVAALVVMEVVCLFGTASAVEPLARLSTAWYHAGFIDYIASHGHVLPNFDARFSWPGMFTLSAFVDAFAGHADATGFLRWAPLFFELLYLPPLRVIARSSGVDEQTGWLATVLFYATNWIEQDYFSPQALNMLFFLVALAVVLGLRRPAGLPGLGLGLGLGERRVQRWRARVSSAWASPARQWSTDDDAGPSRQAGARWIRRRGIALDLLILLFLGASTVSHQLTPFCLALALAACVAAGRFRGPELPTLAVVFGLAWLSFAGASFWEGHPSLLFGGIGNVSGVLGQNVSARVIGSPSHRMIVDLRLAFGGAILLLALCGIPRRRRWGHRHPDRHRDRTIEFLAFSPFLLLGVQSYGGEGLLRCLLFSLPFSSVLAASTVLRCAGGLSRWAAPLRFVGVVIAPAVVAVAVVGFGVWLTVVRGGNDAYESFTTGERAAVVSLYHAARPGQSVAASATFSDEVLPWRDRDLGVLRYVDLPPVTGPAEVTKKLESMRPNWIVLTSSEEKEGELVQGWPTGWQDRVERELLADGYGVYRSWPTARVLERVG